MKERERESRASLVGSKQRCEAYISSVAITPFLKGMMILLVCRLPIFGEQNAQWEEVVNSILIL